MPREYSNPNEYLVDRYKAHTHDDVQRVAKKHERVDKQLKNEKNIPIPETNHPNDLVKNYTERFSVLFEKDTPHKEHNIRAFKRLLYKHNVIRPNDISETYWELQQQQLVDMGHGDQSLTDEIKQQETNRIITDQQSTLDRWVDYLASDDANYPDWLKYITLRSVTEMTNYNKEKESFGTRTKNSIAPFPDLDQGSLARVYDIYIRSLKGEGITPDENLDEEDQEKMVRLIQGLNFSKLYAFVVSKLEGISQENIEQTKGEWKIYHKGSDHMKLVDSINTYNTGWCLAGEETAKTYLQGGDMHVFYTEDDDKDMTIPRIGIFVRDSEIVEVHGIAEQQNLDPHMTDELDAKLKEFGTTGEKYLKRTANMRHLDDLVASQAAGHSLSVEDLRFLYQVDSKIEGFGYQDDPRINELLEGRDKKEDLAQVFNCKPEQISTTKEEALSGDIVYHYGGLGLNGLTSAEGLTLPESIGGNLYLNSLTSAEGLTLPESIGGSLDLNSLTSAEGLTLPESIGGSLGLSSLTSAKGLTLPESIGGNLGLNGLTSAEGLTLPESIGGDLYLNSLTSAKGLTLPESIGGYPYFVNMSDDEKEKLRERYPQHADKII